jgi:6-phosphogluconolactonase (cycloisomerase 2 family)
MKFRKFGQVLLATVVSAGMMLGVSSCANDFTVGYVYVTGTAPNGGSGGQIGAYREDNNNGVLRNVSGQPFGSNGSNPVRALITSGGRFLYVLNAGTKTVDSSGNISYASANISVFSIGGYGQLTFQSSYNSQGLGSIRLAADSTGSHLFVLDSYAPIGNASGAIQTVSSTQSADFPCYESEGVYRATGDITSFSIDPSTGRLTLIPNQQQQNLTYFPVGCFPVDFHATSSQIYTVDAGATSNSDVETIFVYALSTSTGQLTQTQNVPLTTSPAVNIVSINANSANSYIYLIDATLNTIFPYQVGSQGALTAVNGGPTVNSNSAAGNPQQLISVTGTSNSFVYVINSGTGNQTNVGQSDISGYLVNSTNGHLDNPSLDSPYGNGIPSGPVCIFEDPSNQYIYVAGSADNTIAGRKYDTQTGDLKPLPTSTAFPTVGTPSWCLATTSSH